MYTVDAVILCHLLVLPHVAWNLNRGGTKKGPGTRFYPQLMPDGKPKKAQAELRRYQAVEKGYLSSSLNGHTMTNTLTF